MPDKPDVRKKQSSTDSWNGVLSSNDAEGPALVTFGRRRSNVSGDRLQEKHSASSLLFEAKKSIEHLEQLLGSQEFNRQMSTEKFGDPASAVKRAMRARAAQSSRLPLIFEMSEESSEEEGDTPLVEINPQRRPSDREGGPMGDAINQSAFADTPEAEVYIPYGYGSFRAESGILGSGSSQHRSRLPSVLPTLPSSDLGSETEDESKSVDGRNQDEQQDVNHKLSSASTDTNPETVRTAISIKTETTTESRLSSSLYRSLRGKSFKDRNTGTDRPTKVKTQFETNLGQNTAMSDLTRILEDRFQCGVQRKKNELRVAVSLSGEASALVLKFSTTKAATVLVSFRRSKIDFAKVANEDLIEFYRGVRTAFESMHGKEAIISNGEEPIT